MEVRSDQRTHTQPVRRRGCTSMRAPAIRLRSYSRRIYPYNLKKHMPPLSHVLALGCCMAPASELARALEDARGMQGCVKSEALRNDIAFFVNQTLDGGIDAADGPIVFHELRRLHRRCVREKAFGLTD